MERLMLMKKFTFALVALFLGSAVCVWLKYPGEIYVQVFGIVCTGFLVAQAWVDALKPKQGAAQ